MPLLDATLKINDGSEGNYTYPNAKFAKRELRSKVQLNDEGRIENGDFKIGLRSTRFMGATSPLGIDGGSFADPFQPRAAVELGGENVFEGRISKADVACDPADPDGEREWDVTIRGSAFADVLDALSDTHVGNNSVSNFDTRQSLNTHWEANDTRNEDTIYWYDIVGMWRNAVEAVGPFSFEQTIDLFPLEVEYTDSNGNPATYYRAQRPLMCSLQASEFDDNARRLQFGVLPDWTCEKLYEFLHAVTGFRLLANYDPFPSAAVRLTEIEGQHEPPASSLPTLSSYKDRYDLSTKRPQKKDFALWSEGETLEDASPPPDVAVYAAHDPQVAGGEPDNESTRELDIRPPTYERQEKETFSDGDFSERYTTGEPFVDTENIFWTALTETSTAYNDATKLRARDSGGGGKPDVYSEIWLRQHYWRHALVAAPLHEVTGEFDVSDLAPMTVGDIEGGFVLEGKDWLVKSIERNEDKETARVVGVRPTAEYDPSPLAGLVFGAPVNVMLLGRRTSDDTEHFLSVSWEDPTRGALQPNDYDSEVWDQEDNRRITNMAGGRLHSGWNAVSEDDYYDADYARVKALYNLAPEWESPWAESPGSGLDREYII